jgi:hypothetical protein
MLINIISLCNPEKLFVIPSCDDAHLTKLDKRAKFTDELDFLGKTLRVIGEIDDVIYVEGGLRIYKCQPGTLGNPNGFMWFRAYHFSVLFELLPDPVVDDYVTKFDGMRRGFLNLCTFK